MSFSTGQFLLVLKMSNVMQLKVDYTNYRPISLLSNIGKFIENLTLKRTFNLLEVKNQIYSLQFGFQKKKNYLCSD